MGKAIQWLGPWESIKDDPGKLDKMCVLWTKSNKKALKNFSGTKPDKVVLTSFITNPRGVLFPIGANEWGYGNLEYLTWWQETAQAMWDVVKPEIETVCPVVPLTEAAATGLYSEEGLQEQKGGMAGYGEAFHDYPFGTFNQRDWGGWKWFGLVIGDWDQSWDVEQMPKMGAKEKIAHKAKPKYYKSYSIQGNQLVESKKSEAVYAKPRAANVLHRRYSMPWPVGVKSDSKSATRYEFVSRTIMDKLNAKWTLSVWNAINFNYSVAKNTSALIIKPEIILSLGRYSDTADGAKNFGKMHSSLHRHWEAVYAVKVGLNEKTQIDLVTHVKKETSPIWDGSYTKIWEIMGACYKTLLDLGIQKLKGLIS
jgi:hypothetical protein